MKIADYQDFLNIQTNTNFKCRICGTENVDSFIVDDKGLICSRCFFQLDTPISNSGRWSNLEHPAFMRVPKQMASSEVQKLQTQYQETYLQEMGEL